MGINSGDAVERRDYRGKSRRGELANPQDLKPLLGVFHRVSFRLRVASGLALIRVRSIHLSMCGKRCQVPFCQLDTSFKKVPDTFFPPTGFVGLGLTASC